MPRFIKFDKHRDFTPHDLGATNVSQKCPTHFQKPHGRRRAKGEYIFTKTCEDIVPNTFKELYNWGNN